MWERPFFHEGMRDFQDRFDGRRVAEAGEIVEVGPGLGGVGADEIDGEALPCHVPAGVLG